MAKEITVICKNCGKEFKYDEECYWLMAEKGESRFERCEECREEHGKRLSGLKVPYFPFQEVRPSRDFNFFGLKYSSHGERVLQRKEKERVDYSENLIITDEEILSLYQLLERNQVVVVTAPTGAGKSTFIPAKLIEPLKNYSGDFVDRLLHQGQIIITQPRTLATIQVPQTSASMIGSSVGPGHLEGYRHSGEDLSDRWNLAITITDGTLPNWIREGRLDQYSLIMVDEAHERSCNIDHILGFFRQALQRFPQLRLIISSATINTQKFLDAFREANISSALFDLSFLIERKKHRGYIHFWKDENAYRLSKEGSLEKVKDCHCWLCQKSIREKEEFWRNQKDNFKEFELPEVMANFVSRILKETKKGDILVFLHGEKVINKTVRKIKARQSESLIEVIPAYRRIQDDVEKMLARKTNKRRVIVGTNLLETSITLEGAVYGVDSGYIKEVKWDLDTQIDTLPTELHSQDGRKQRWGRLARTEDGYVYNLYTKEEFEQAEEHTLPEITRSCLEDSLVNLKGAGITDVDQFLWMEKPSDHPQMAREIKRAHQALKDRGIIDQKGEITERALELLGIPRSSPETSFLFSADAQGILFEAMITLWLMSTREGEARAGANLYTKAFGLLLWNPIWDAKTKTKVWAIHQGLRIGCRDDLDFVMKLAICLQKAEAKGVAEKWARYHFVNYERIQKLLSEIDELITERLGEEREESVREINLSCLEKVRTLMLATWPEKVVNLNPGEPITYPVAGKTKVGVVSPHCVGSWQKQKRAIVAAAIEQEAIVENYPRRVPTASFMVQLPGQNFEGARINLFIDQIFPIGSWVRVKEEDGRTYIIKLEEFPSPIKVSYQATLDLPEDYEELKERKEEEIPFDENFLIDEELTVPFEGKWIGEIRTNQARIVEWTEQDGQPMAILSPFKESEITLGKEKKDTLELKIHRVARDPVSNGGWIVAETKEEFDIPIEVSEMSLSPQGPGLERLEGQILNLIVKEVDEKGLPKLSNIKRIIDDLRNLKEEISGSAKATKVSQRSFIELSGFVTEINEEEEKAIVVVPRENGVFHPFEVAQTYVPGGNLKNLRIGEEVTVCLFDRSDRDKISTEYFTEIEIKNLPKKWELREEEGKLLVPLSLEDNDFRDWPARPEAIDFVKRHSWQFCLNARIGSLKERLSEIEPGDIVIGVIKEIEYDEDETIKSARVLVEGDIPVFVFGSDLSTEKLEVEIPFLVKTVDPESGLLRLAEKAKEEERERKRKEWIERKRANIRRWEATNKKAREAIRKIEENIAGIEFKLRTTNPSPKWAEIFRGWIEENKRQIQEIEAAIRVREEKILDAKSKLANMD